MSISGHAADVSEMIVAYKILFVLIRT